MPKVDAKWCACLQTLLHSDWKDSDWIRSVAISTDGRRIVSSSNEDIKLWDAESGVCLQTLIGHTHLVLSVAISADGRRIASGSGDRTVRLWDAESSAVPHKLECHPNLEGYFDAVKARAISKDSCKVASGSDNQSIKL